MKKLFAFLLILSLMISSACSAQRKTSDLSDTNYTYNFIECEATAGISNINNVSLPDNLDAHCKSYSFSYDVDGTKVDGYISIPDGCNKNNKFKCILYNRGGNSNIGHLTDTVTAKLCTATNRIVIASQYRTIDEFGGEDINDVLRLVDLCESFEFTDMSDFCSIGISRGGMMTYMAARADNRIKRIVSISGVSDLSAAYNEREDMKILLNNYIGGSPQDLPEEYEKRSAICWAEEIKVPTLIIHSTYDKQVNYSQAEEMYEALQNYGVNVTLKTYRDSTHGLHTDDIKNINDWIN